MDLKKTQGQGREHLCDTGMPVRNGNPGNDRTTTTKVASVRKQLGTKIARVTRAELQEKNGGVIEESGVQRSLTEREWQGADYCGQDTLKGWRMTGYRREPQSYVSRAGVDEGGQG